MSSKFLEELSRQARFSDLERSILSAVDARSADDVDALVRAFPSLSGIGIRIPLVSNAVVSQVSASYSGIANTVAASPPPTGLGAEPPPGAPFTIRSVVGIPAAGGPPVPPIAAAGHIDLRLNPWPVRDQGQRGTCVAFGSAACVEHLTQAAADLAEQFLYWAIKDHSNDPQKQRDGTWLVYARDMLQADGICVEPLHPYVGTPVIPVAGGVPSASAKGDASGRTMLANVHAARPTGAAAMVLQLLQNSRPVAICLPVFQDPLTPNGPNNWTTNVGWSYGRVLNPPPTSVVVGGHCVCVTGFVPDASEPLGGYFVVRNSWGTAWGALSPSGGSVAPEQGYGEVSASYVDTYSWELLQL